MDRACCDWLASLDKNADEEWGVQLASDTKGYNHSRGEEP